MRKFFSYKIFKDKSGSALALTMFILAGMLIVAISGSYIVLVGIKASGVQSESTKAYFAAESGAEKVLWEMRKNSWTYGTPSLNTPVFSENFSSGANYNVYYIYFPPLIFDSIGEFMNTKRSVQLRIGT
jgi:orotate phosphoribosyltransferase-like protein